MYFISIIVRLNRHALGMYVLLMFLGAIITTTGCDENPNPKQRQQETKVRRPCPGDPCFSPALARQSVSGMNGARFGMVRSDGTKEKMHKGIDLEMVTGSKLYAMYDGYVYDVKEGNGWGNYIIFLSTKGNNRIMIMYAHLRRATVRPGEFVKAGDEVAISGDSGNLEDAIYFGSVNAHMHLEVREFQPYIRFHELVPVDPEPFLGTDLGYSGRPSFYRDCNEE